MAWNFRYEAKTGAETALDACDYFVDEVLEVWHTSGAARACYAVAMNG